MENSDFFFFLNGLIYDNNRDRLFRSLSQNYKITFGFIVNGCATLRYIYEKKKYIEDI